MKICVFSSKPYDQQFLSAANEKFGYELAFLEPRLTAQTVGLAVGCEAICAFVNDNLDGEIIEQLAQQGVRFIALRSAGFNHVDLVAADRVGIKVARVPAYSPYAVAEHTASLILALNRKTHRAVARVREGNFSLDGLLGFDLHGRTVGIVGTGQIGAVFARIANGFGCRLLGFDPFPNPSCESLGMTYLPLEDLLAQSDIVSLHCPLTPATHHLINAKTIQSMKRGTMLINTSRGAIIDTRAVIEALKSGQIGSLGIDVYEEEAEYFFEDLSHNFISDDVLARLLTFPNVIVTGHQGFFTREALQAIAETTLQNVKDLAEKGSSPNQVMLDAVKSS